MIGNKRIIWKLALFLGLIIYTTIFQGSRGIWGPDEGRYTDIAVRMLQTGDFIGPSLNDDLPHFAKPPLAYWAIAGGIKLLGWNEWGARLPIALAFICTVLLIYAINRRVTPNQPWLSPVIYATSLFPFIASNIVTTDTLLTLFETLAVSAFICWWQRKDASVFLIIMWSGFGLSFLTKGPPGLLPLLVILVFILLTEGWRSLPRLFSPAGLGLFVVIGLGWYIMVAYIKPGMVKYFIGNEVAGRIFSGIHNRNPEWYKGFTVYIPILLVGTLPWTFYLLSKVRLVHKTLFSRSWWRIKLKGDQWIIFLLLWILLPLIVFIVSKSRMPLYILPLFVPISLIAGRLPIFQSKRNQRFYMLAAWIAFLIALKFMGSLFPYHKDNRSLAKAIEGLDRPLPAEVVFINANPFWGLSLYLNCEVEGVVTSPEAKTPFLIETLVEEFLENEPRLLFVAKKSENAEIIELSHSLGYPVRNVGQTDSWVFLALPDELDGKTGIFSD